MEKFLDERNAAYDTLAKRFLARKTILAHILKNVVSEFADSSLQDFIDLKSSNEKEKILCDEYDITLTRDMRKELTDMGGLMEPLLKVATEQVAEKTAAEIEKKTLLNNIRKAMKNWHLSATEVMNGFEISPERQKELLPLI